MGHSDSSVHRVPDSVSVLGTSVVVNVTCARLDFMISQDVCHAPATRLVLIPMRMEVAGAFLVKR